MSNNNYTVQYSNGTKSITVYANTKDDSTSLSLIGRNYPGYGPAIAENFLHLLENFSNSTSPSSAVIGQLWYDTSVDRLKLWDGITWKPTNGVHQGPSAPENWQVGDIWVDTLAQILYIRNEIEWIQVGPSFSTVLRTGAYPTKILGTDGNSYNVIFMYVNDYVMEIISTDTFTPVQGIDGFDSLVTGVNVTKKTFLGNKPQVNGTAAASYALRQTSPSEETVSANNFVRNDINQRITGQLIIGNDNGLLIGQTTATFALLKQGAYATFLNSVYQGRFAFKGVDQNGLQYKNPLMLIDTGNKFVGINTLTPEKELDVNGSLQVTGNIINLSSASNAISFAGGGSINGIVSLGAVVVSGQSTFTNKIILGDPAQQSKMSVLEPASTGTNKKYDIGTGTNAFNSLYVREVRGPDSAGSGTVFYGRLASVPGSDPNSRTGSAEKLYKQTEFKVAGDARLAPNNQVFFDGSTPGVIPGDTDITKTFNIVLHGDSVKTKTTATTIADTDQFLIYQPGIDASSLQKISRKDFLSDLLYSAIPTGGVLPYAGSITPGRQESPSNPKADWLFCDGSYRARVGPYASLYNVIGAKYGYSSVATFAVPNMDTRLYASTATNAPSNPPGVRFIIKT
jgi:hypothetical protein